MKTMEIFDKNDNLADGPSIRTEIDFFWNRVFNFAFTNMLRKAFYSVRIKNAQNYELRNPEFGNIIYANHCCWWDGMIGHLLCNRVFKTKLHMMIEQLYRFPLLAKTGAFSVDKNSPQSAIKALNYSVEILKNPANSLYIFPQGKVMPQDFRPIKFANGISYICKKLGQVNLIPITNRYTFLREDRPESLIEVGKPIIISDGKNIDKKLFTEELEKSFEENLDKQRLEIAMENLDGYDYILKSRLCVAKLIEKNFTSFVRNLN